MEDALVISITRHALITALLVVTPLLVLAMLVGLVVSIVQTATSIQEQTLTFVPKILAVLIGLMFLNGWMIKTMVNFTTYLWSNIPNFIK
ncbi:MAG: flagellar biosynthesis protein FliQ [Synergistetes bacterium]|nr:flagellar biosynthesis protein FliQ [Synergistota bacterium]